MRKIIFDDGDDNDDESYDYYYLYYYYHRLLLFSIYDVVFSFFTAVCLHLLLFCFLLEFFFLFCYKLLPSEVPRIEREN